MRRCWSSRHGNSWSMTTRASWCAATHSWSRRSHRALRTWMNSGRKSWVDWCCHQVSPAATIPPPCCLVGFVYRLISHDRNNVIAEINFSQIVPLTVGLACEWAVEWSHHWTGAVVIPPPPSCLVGLAFRLKSYFVLSALLVGQQRRQVDYKSSALAVANIASCGLQYWIDISFSKFDIVQAIRTLVCWSMSVLVVLG